MANSVQVKIDKSGFTKKTRELIAKTVTKEVLQEIGETLVRMNKKNARTGKVADGSSFPELSANWKKRRKALANVNATHLAYAPNRSNATLTGEFIDAIEYVIDETKKTVTVDFNDENHALYVGVKGGRVGGPAKTNSEIATFFLDRGVRILAVNEEMKKRIDFILQTNIKRILNFNK